jgi:hypothetical protein
MKQNEEKKQSTTAAATGGQPNGVTFACGAKRSYVAPYYCAIPGNALRRLAMRYTTGSEKYDPKGWLIGLLESANWRKGDREFFSDVFNHVIDHLYRFLEEGNEETDNLAAAAWGVFALMWAEEQGIFGPEPVPVPEEPSPGPAPEPEPASKVERFLQELFGTVRS